MGSLRPIYRRENTTGCEGRFVEFNPLIRKGIAQSIANRRWWRDRATLSHAFQAVVCMHRRCKHVTNLNLRHLGRAGQ